MSAFLHAKGSKYFAQNSTPELQNQKSCWICCTCVLPRSPWNSRNAVGIPTNTVPAAAANEGVARTHLIPLCWPLESWL